MRHDRHHHIELEISVCPGPGNGGVVADHLRADHHHRFAHHRVHLARHDRAARLRGRQLNLADATARPTTEPANVVCDLEQTDRDRLQLPAHFNNRVLPALRLKMIPCFIKGDAGALLQMPEHFAGKLDMAI